MRDAANSVYIKRERSEANTVFSHRPRSQDRAGASFSLNSTLDGKEWILVDNTAISSVGNVNVSVFETEDIIR
jgi:hypothetical protein